MIGSTLRDELTRAELERILHEGFFPEARRRERPRRSRGGLQEFGLPYASRPGHHPPPGGVSRPPRRRPGRRGAVQRRRHDPGRPAPAGDRADRPLAARRRRPPRADRRARPSWRWPRAPRTTVWSGAGWASASAAAPPRTFYVGVGAAQSGAAERAVCLAPKGLEEGTAVALARDFRLVTNRPVSFKLYRLHHPHRSARRGRHAAAAGRRRRRPRPTRRASRWRLRPAPRTTPPIWWSCPPSSPSCARPAAMR